MRMMRDSSPELDRECPGPYASNSATRFPRSANASAVHAPTTPAPTTTTSYFFAPLIAHVSYLISRRSILHICEATPLLRHSSEERNFRCPCVEEKFLLLRRCPCPHQLRPARQPLQRLIVR